MALGVYNLASRIKDLTYFRLCGNTRDADMIKPCIQHEVISNKSSQCKIKPSSFMRTGVFMLLSPVAINRQSIEPHIYRTLI